MRKILIAALALAIASPAIAAPTEPKPCVVQAMTKDSPEYKRLVRDMRRKGYRIEVQSVSTGERKQVSVGGDFRPTNLRHANVVVPCD